MKLKPTPPLLGAMLVIAAVACGCAGGRAGSSATSDPANLNRNFTDPELDVDAYVDRFEAESREVFAEREAISAAAEVSPGDRIADIGAGTGFYSRLFAEKVGSSGWVWAIDIGPRMLEHINETVRQAGIANVTALLGRTDSIGLPPESIDLAFLCDTYHHLDAVEPMLASIESALVPGGLLVVVDFERIPGESRDWILGHVRAGKEVVRVEIEAAGFELVEDVAIDGLEENYLLKFRKG